ncbi:TetR/AcrR family transcriptional regulator [Kineosporia succinea]|uniref:AcrR family transcriptional regulator n=1 Tax=Kineosporia succinea TaxID=84632 RepID=A0ABT9PCL5_9ACTN|nr:TetR/AcrR family transcriptional regulator [Kineosporia succinea]MDP9830456.1 AcrR family transcriptional regulator [Kineosporia succinea]
MSEAPDRRTAIVDVAARLLKEHGPAAVTTRAVAQEAGVQAPAIYRLFGDKDGLLEAVAEHVMASFVAQKAALVETAAWAETDPIDDLRAGWNTQIDFSLANPAVFRLLSDPGRIVNSPAARNGREVLQARMHRVALTGRLRVSEARAVAVMQASGVGTIQLLLATPPEERDAGLADCMFEGVLQQILTGTPGVGDPGNTATVVAFRALAPRLDVLSPAERRLLGEWLDRALASR